MELSDILIKLGVALGLGLLVGLQRERNESSLAGIRTFPVITMLGSLLALVQADTGGWLLPAGLLSIVLLMVVGKYLNHLRGDSNRGLTTEVAMLFMFGIGCFLVQGSMAVAVVLVGILVVLLQLKVELHAMVRKIGDKDFRAMMTFVLIAFVILPILPNQAYGPFQAFNPYKIWLLVVLIVGISLAGYILYKIFGARSGSLLSGVLGGLISSTATTVSYARKTRINPENAPMATLVILIASTVVFARVLFLVGLVSRQYFMIALGPFAVIAGVMLVLGIVAWLHARRLLIEMPEPANPSELKSALVFGALFALVLVAVAAAKAYLGTGGLYLISVISGLTDMDAITVSTSQMVVSEQISPGLWWRLILAAAASNLVFKGLMAGFLGGFTRFKTLQISFLIAVAATLCIIFFWPG